MHNATTGLDIAIIGMSGRFPGARTLEEFWQNLHDGIESVSVFSDEELIAAGVDPEILKDPQYVKTGTVMDDIELFDADFFGFYAREAQITDPQQRVFLECAWQAIERAGYNPQNYPGLIGIYAGCGASTYALFNLFSNEEIRNSVQGLQLHIGTDKDFLCTRVSYKLNLRGPSVSIQTACSTSLVAVHFACHSLLNYQCDMALTGGVSIRLPQKLGYKYHEGGILSPDGRCRAFDAKAAGMLGGAGVGVVLLKRLADAIADGDQIYAIIKGSAINNDGSLKVGYTAPSVDGQAEVIATAQAISGVSPETISYIETHGTGTVLGDPIEIAALTQVFRQSTDAKRFCAIGSLKTNIGAADAAAGVAGLIKTALALKHKELPPSLNFEEPNPAIDFANSPFYVNTKLSEWKTNGLPRRAGISSFGIGGTNAHVIVEEAPELEESGPSRPWQLLLLSARTDTALDAVSANLGQHLRSHPALSLADAAYTLKVGRKTFNQRRMLVCRNVEDAAKALEMLDPKRIFSAVQERHDRPLAFMFTGQGSQYIGMAKELYESEPTFREEIDSCAEALNPHLGVDIREVIYPSEEESPAATEKLNQTCMTQPALFVIEYALAKLWMELGIKPRAMIGHSIGEYVAACLAGVFSLEDALKVVATRGRLMQSVPPGAMLSVALSEDAVQGLLGKHLSLAAVNAPEQCVVAGPSEAVDALEKQIIEQGTTCQRLRTSHAFHSAMMEPILEPFKELLQGIQLQPPAIPYISNVTGTWVTEAEATDARYWVQHLRQAVRFGEGVGELLKDQSLVLLEVGPGQTLTSLARRQMDRSADGAALSSLRRPQQQKSDIAFILETLGRLWLAGVPIEWTEFYAHERRYRVLLPTYPFERQRYWIEPAKKQPKAAIHRPTSIQKEPDIADWFYVPSWKRSMPPQPLANQSRKTWLVFMDECGLGAQIVKQLEQQGQRVITAKTGNNFSRIGENSYSINPQSEDDYATLMKELRSNNKIPDRIAHLWSVTRNDVEATCIEFFDKSLYSGFYSLLFLAKAFEQQHVINNIQINVVSNGMHEVSNTSLVHAEKATLLAACKVIPQEYINITCRSFDVVLTAAGKIDHRIVDQLSTDFFSKPSDLVVAYRDKHRWVQSFEPFRIEATSDRIAKIREGGVYLITGGLGNIGLELAESLAKTAKVKLILVARSPLPSKEDWSRYLQSADSQDAIRIKIRKLQAIETFGAEVLIASADVADEIQMASVIAQVIKHFGGLHGVIHGAGVIGTHSVQDADPQTCTQHFRAKVHGVMVLEKLLRDRPLDFCLLTSSLSSVLGGIGFSTYAAANIFMDAFAHNCNRRSNIPWISINYDGWNFAKSAPPDSGFGTGLAKLALTPAEGIEVFKRILSWAKATQVMVSTGNLEARIGQWIKLESLHATEIPRDAKSIANSALHSRPNLASLYVAPRNETERGLADIWRALLGIEQVGVYDNFFELGGDSLLAIQVISNVRKAFHVELSPSTLFQRPTLEEMASFVALEHARTSGDTLFPAQTVEQLTSNARQKTCSDSSAWLFLVALQPNGTKPPFFWIHGENSNAFLPRYLGPDQPLYGILHQSRDGKPACYTTVESMATHYLKEIRTVQSEGPYFLGGYCIGGTIAYEIAQQLREDNQQVKLLLLLDPGPPGLREVSLSFSSRSRTKLRSFSDEIRHHWRRFPEVKPQERRKYVVAAIKAHLREQSINLTQTAKRFAYKCYSLTGIRYPVPVFFRNIYLEGVYKRAFLDYRPKRYPGRIIILNTVGAYYDFLLQWRTLAGGGVELIELDRKHTEIVFKEPAIQEFGKELKICLDRAQINGAGKSNEVRTVTQVREAPNLAV